MKILILLILAVHATTWDYSPEELDEKRFAVESWEKLATMPIPPDGELLDHIRRLGDALMKTSPNRNNPALGGEKVHFLLKEKLLSIPGHAEYYRDRINTSRKAMEEARDSPDAPATLGGAVVRMNQEQSWGFQTLADLPSVETVRVLGDFLSDDRGSDLSVEQRLDTGETPPSRSAVSAFSKLGIANPPTPPVRTSEDVTAGMSAWRQWYAEVESGRRTFRFIGDPMDYTLRGPSKRGAIELGSRNMKRTGSPSPANSQAALEPQRKAPVVLPYVIAGLFLLVSIFIYLRGKRKHD